jgi:hypothetical protein
MDIEAIEKINRNRDIANSITELVELWTHGLARECDIDDISFRDWCDLQESIERFLNEQDSK